MLKTGEKSPSISNRGRRKVTILQYKGQELSPLQACIHAKLLQLLCDPVDCSPPCSSVHRILQARILEWVAMLSPRGYSQPRNWTHVSSSPALAGGFFMTFYFILSRGKKLGFCSEQGVAWNGRRNWEPNCFIKFSISHPVFNCIFPPFNIHTYILGT